ncbi:2-phospho-L-lactate guanylyltransferase [Microbacterium sp. NPDC091313]
MSLEPPAADARWTVIVPVKAAAVGKSRLDAAAADRAALARAIALDTIEAVTATAAVERVIVVTSDAELPRAVRALPNVSVVADPGAAGLDAAVAAGAAAAGLNTARAALLGDLPALHPAELAAALAAAADVERGLVADAEGTGTTLVTARPGAVWVSAFGEGSAERHRLLGCVDLPVPEGTGLRRDVDTVEQLAAARALGLGTRTAALTHLEAPA